MTAADRQYARLRQLTFARLEGRATPAECDELDRQLAEDPIARETYVAYVQLAADLHWDHASGRPMPAAIPEPVRSRWWHAVRERASHPMALSWLVAGLFMASMLFAMALWTLSGDRSRMVAEVIFAREVRWSPAALVEGRPPAGLQDGQAVELLAGTIALRFQSGALVLIEGPAELAAQGPNGLQLQSGKLAARVPADAVGFLVSTPTVDVVDLGTEFSLAVSAEQTEVQVLTGRVEVQRVHAGERTTTRLLAAGEAALFHDSPSQGFIAQEKEMNRSALVGMMALLAAADMATAAPIGYWQFQDAAPGNSAVTVASLFNSPTLNGTGLGNAGGAAPVYSGDVVGSAISDGLNGPIVNADNSASLRFTNTGGVNSNGGSLVRVLDPGGAGSLLKPTTFTYEGFLKIDTTNQINFPTVLGKERTDRDASVGGNQSGTSLTLDLSSAPVNPLRARVDSDTNGGPGFNQGFGGGASGSVADGEWHHFAATYDGTRLQLFLDYVALGAPVATTNPIVYDDGPLNIGTLSGGRAFNGWLDEIRLSSGVLATDQFLRATTIPEPDSRLMWIGLSAGGLAIVALRLGYARRRHGKARND